MHIIKDENGNICEHAHSHEHTHTHTYEHSHPHDHEHGHEDDHHHSHEHSHEEGHCHSHEHCAAAGTEHCHTHSHDGHCHGEAPKNQTEALLQYMLDHNTHHAAELDQMAQKLLAEGHAGAAEQIRKAVDEFQKGNLYLGLAISMMK